MIFVLLGAVIFLFIPFIICGILVGIIIRVVQTKLIKSKVLKAFIVISILFGIGITLINIKEERPSASYTKMKEISDNKNLKGLSKEEVVALLGEPRYEKYTKKDGREVYRYHAGGIDKGLFLYNISIFFDCSYGYVLNVYFDENNKVSSTSMQCVP